MLVKAAPVVALLAMLAAPAQATSIYLIGGLRDVNWEVVQCLDDCFPMDEGEIYIVDEGVSDSNFDEDITRPLISLSQHSHIGASTISGTGVVQKPLSLPAGWWAIGYSSLDVMFQVDEPTAFSLSGNATTGRFGPNGFGQPVFLDASGPFAVTGMLHPGTNYVLYFLAGLESNEGGNESWTFSFALVPEPGTLGLVAIGVIVLTSSRRRRG